MILSKKCYFQHLKNLLYFVAMIVCRKYVLVLVRMANSNLSFILKGEIHSVKSDGTNRTEFAPAAILGSPVGLALDWITQNLYYTNPSTQSVEVEQIKMGSVFYFLFLSEGRKTLTRCWFIYLLNQVLKLRGEVQYRKTLITNNGSPTGAGSPVGIAVDPARG